MTVKIRCSKNSLQFNFRMFNFRGFLRPRIINNRENFQNYGRSSSMITTAERCKLRNFRQKSFTIILYSRKVLHFKLFPLWLKMDFGGWNLFSLRSLIDAAEGCKVHERVCNVYLLLYNRIWYWVTSCRCRSRGGRTGGGPGAPSLLKLGAQPPKWRNCDIT